MRVLICGSRTFDDAEAVRAAVALLSPGDVVIHGAARGADSLAGEAATDRGLTVEAYPADWARYGRGAGPIHNRRMLDEGRPDVVWAFVAGSLTNSRGTKNMVTQARRAGVPVEVREYTDLGR